MRKKGPHKIVYVLVGILLVVVLMEVMLYRTLSALTHPSKKEVAINPVTFLLNVNEVPFRTQDGVELHGWLIPGKVGYPAVIIAHDYGSSRSETLGKLEGLVSDLNKQGYFVFLFDFRGHGQSSSTSSLGYREANDVEAALREVLKYKQIGRRIAVLGIGMGAIAATRACSKVDETKLVILDSVYTDIRQQCTNAVISEWPAGRYIQPFLLKIVDWNLRMILDIKSTDLELEAQMPQLYPRAVLFVEATPPGDEARSLYEAAREPKELLQLGQTAADDLMGDARHRYKVELENKIQKYFPALTDQQTLEIGK